LLIGGSWVESESGQKFKTINPANEEALADVSQATAKDVDKAVAAARQAFDKGTTPSKNHPRRIFNLFSSRTLVAGNRLRAFQIAEQVGRSD